MVQHHLIELALGNGWLLTADGVNHLIELPLDNGWLLAAKVEVLDRCTHAATIDTVEPHLIQLHKET